MSEFHYYKLQSLSNFSFLISRFSQCGKKTMLVTENWLYIQINIHFAQIKDFPPIKLYYWSPYKVQSNKATASPSYITNLSLWVCEFANGNDSDSVTTDFRLDSQTFDLHYNTANSCVLGGCVVSCPGEKIKLNPGSQLDE